MRSLQCVCVPTGPGWNGCAGWRSNRVGEPRDAAVLWVVERNSFRSLSLWNEAANCGGNSESQNGIHSVRFPWNGAANRGGTE